MNTAKSPNINHLWAKIMIEELIRNEVRYFCIAPGSRSSPLVTAVAENKNAQSFIHFDERALAFHALGYVSATKHPCALICTSGTAAANFYPAIIEASKKKLPLIVLTADRPPELRNTGADQTMDQVRLYGTYVRWECDLPCPTQDIAPNFILTTIDQAVYRSAAGNPPGPVHINCMYREPLAPARTQKDFINYCRPIVNWEKSTGPYTQYFKPKNLLSAAHMQTLYSAIKKIDHGVIAVGKLSTEEERAAVIKLAEKLNWPIFPDVTSGMRLGFKHPLVIAYFDQLLLSDKIEKTFPFDGVLQIGGRMTSKRWYEATRSRSISTYLMVLNHSLRNDPQHTVTHRIECSVTEFCQNILKGISQRAPSKTLSDLRSASAKLHSYIDGEFNKSNKLTEPAVIRSISEHIIAQNGLFLANSMPIRDMDMYARPDKNPVNITANRGVSGIDGNLATAAGFLNGSDTPATLVIGDLALLHDLNSLAMLSKISQPIVIVVINNNGGGIFSFLPISEIGEAFERYFATPHNLTFQGACDMFGITYHCPSDLQEFISTYKNMLKNKVCGLIEVRTKRDENAAFHRRLQNNIRLKSNLFLSGKQRKSK